MIFQTVKAIFENILVRTQYLKKIFFFCWYFRTFIKIYIYIYIFIYNGPTTLVKENLLEVENCEITFKNASFSYVFSVYY